MPLLPFPVSVDPGPV